jgi:hypothetical protein
VFAHARCNRDKRDLLADLDHLAKWKATNLSESDVLTTALINDGLVQDKLRSRHIAIWAYEQGEAAKSHVWSESDRLRRLTSDWRRIMQN